MVSVREPICGGHVIIGVHKQSCVVVVAGNRHVSGIAMRPNRLGACDFPYAAFVALQIPCLVAWPRCLNEWAVDWATEAGAMANHTGAQYTPVENT